MVLRLTRRCCIQLLRIFSGTSSHSTGSRARDPARSRGNVRNRPVGRPSHTASGHPAHCSAATAERAEHRCAEGTLSLCDQGKLGGAWGWTYRAPVSSGQHATVTRTGPTQAMNLTSGWPDPGRSRAMATTGSAAEDGRLRNPSTPGSTTPDHSHGTRPPTRSSTPWPHICNKFPTRDTRAHRLHCPMAKRGHPRRDGLKRRVGTREPKRTFLVLCEGKKTEPGYLAAL